MDDIVIRPFEAGDRKLVEYFFAQMGSDSRAFFNRDNGNERRALAFFECDDSARIRRWMAVLDGRMVGYVFLYKMEKKVPWLGIAVADDMKGRHLGERLIDTTKEYCRENGMSGIILTTHVANIRAQVLYERCGFEHLGTHSSGEFLYIFRA
jgi:ribosomal protein S18 acetylase RimI-like enzyme